MDRSSSVNLLRRTLSPLSLKDSNLSQLAQATANFTKRLKMDSPRLLNPQRSTPVLRMKEKAQFGMSQHQMKRLISELYFKKTRHNLKEPLGLPEFNPRILRPKRDFTVKQQASGKDISFFPPKRMIPVKSKGFGYVIGQRKDILGKTKYNCRRLGERSKTKRLVDKSIEQSRVVSPLLIKINSLDTISSKDSYSADRINPDEVLEYCSSVLALEPPRRVIYQSPLGKELAAKLKLLL